VNASALKLRAKQTAPAVKVILQFRVFVRRFRNPIRVPRIENQVPRIRDNHHWALRITENRVPRKREIVHLQLRTRYLTFSLNDTPLEFNPVTTVVRWLAQATQKNSKTPKLKYETL